MSQNIESLFKRAILYPAFWIFGALLSAGLASIFVFSVNFRDSELERVSTELSSDVSEMLDRGDWDAVVRRIQRLEEYGKRVQVTIPNVPSFGLKESALFFPACAELRLKDRENGKVCVSLLDTFGKIAVSVFTAALFFLFLVFTGFARHRIKQIGTQLVKRVESLRSILNGTSAKFDSDNVAISEFQDIERLISHVLIEGQRNEREQNERLKGFAHDIRSPIGVLKTIAKIGNPKIHDEHLEIFDEAAIRVDRLIDRLLRDDLMKHGLQSSFRSLFLLFEGFKLRAEQQKVSFAFGFDFKDSDRGRDFVRREYVLLSRVFSNLVENAISEAIPSAEKSVRSRLEIGNRGILFSVENHLNGKKEKYSVESESGLENRYGLGLGIVNELLRKANGTLRIDVTHSRSVVFLVEIPVPEESSI